MKLLSKMLQLVVCLTVIFFMAGIVIAETGTIIDDVLQVPKAGEAPEIDGELDGVWLNVTETKMNLYGDDTTLPDDWLDHYSTYRIMYDADYFYFFGHVMDDIVEVVPGDAHVNDSWELFFDNDNLKTDGPYVSGNDIQWRWVYGLTEITPGEADVGEWAWADTDFGYDFELKIPATTLDAISFDLAADHEFWWEVQVNEREGGERVTQSKWWSSSNESWHNASYFGTAMLTDREVTSVLDIQKVPGDAPTIDGEMDAVWETIPEISMNTYGADDDIATFVGGKEDLQFSYRVMWDETALYFFGEVMDDIIEVVPGDAHVNDSWELFFDNDNLKTDGPYVDGNDIQWRWVYGLTEITPGEADVGEWAWADTDYGYIFELKIPADTLDDNISFALEEGHEFGFEVQLNDRENGERETIGKWWSASNESWHNASYFGTAELVPVGGSAAISPEPKVAGNFRLSQNYPNPFNPKTTIPYTIDKRSTVKLTVYNILGNEIATLINEVKTPGSYTASFNGSNLTSGVYFYKLEAGTDVFTKKMMLLK